MSLSTGCCCSHSLGDLNNEKKIANIFFLPSSCCGLCYVHLHLYSLYSRCVCVCVCSLQPAPGNFMCWAQNYYKKPNLYYWHTASWLPCGSCLRFSLWYCCEYFCCSGVPNYFTENFEKISLCFWPFLVGFFPTNIIA